MSLWDKLRAGRGAHALPGEVAALYIFCDGGAGAHVPIARDVPALHGPTSPGQAGCAAVAYAASGRLQQWSYRLLPSLTNVEAEYAGLILGLELAQRLAAPSALFLLDSIVVVGQMNGRYAVHSARLRPWHQQAWEARRRLAQARICYIPRAWNVTADALARQARLPWPALHQWIEQQQDAAWWKTVVHTQD